MEPTERVSPRGASSSSAALSRGAKSPVPVRVTDVVVTHAIAKETSASADHRMIGILSLATCKLYSDAEVLSENATKRGRRCPSTHGLALSQDHLDGAGALERE